MRDFEEGKIEIPNIDKSYILARKVVEFKPYFAQYYQPGFVAALLPLFSNKLYSQKEMMHKLENCPDEIRLKSAKKVIGYRLQLEEIYNYKRQQANKVSFKYI